MVLPLVCLIGGTLAAWLLVAAVLGEPSATPATLGVAITLPPAVATLLAVVKVSRRWPEAGPAVVTAGTFFRMAAAVGFVAALGGRAEGLGTTSEALGQWTTGFYLLTLVLETALLYGLLSRPEGAKDDPPAD